MDTLRIPMTNIADVSDGYHTFRELYDHRDALFIALAGMSLASRRVWKSRKHSDGSVMEGWFILGIGKKEGDQITYHLPMTLWNHPQLVLVEDLPRAPEFDGHTSDDVISRLGEL